MAKKKTKKCCTGSLQLSFPDYITRGGTCRNPNAVEPGQPGFEPLDVFWHRDKLDSKCDDSKVHTISGAIFLDEHGKTVATESQHSHAAKWGTL